MRKCPKCNSRKVVPIVYGYPAPQTYEAFQRGEIKLGGCIIEPGQPDYSCLECRYSWLSKPLSDDIIHKLF